MFSISAKAMYGLTAMMDLGVRAVSGPLQIRDIATANDIPQHYLEQLLVALKRAGLVESYRGARGGYALAKTPREILVVDILECLDGRIELLGEKKQETPPAFFFVELEEKIRDLLSINLEELITRKQSRDKSFVYTI